MANIARVSVLLPIALYFVLFNNNYKIKGFSLFIFYLIYCFLNEVINFYLNDIKKIDSYFFFNLFTIIEYSFISAFYYVNFKIKKGKKIILFTSISFAIYFFSYFTINKNQNSSFASWPATIESILLLIFSIYYLFDQVYNAELVFIYSKKSFWIVIAIIIYLSGTFFLFILAQKMMDDEIFLNQYILMNSILYIIKNILISIAFLIPKNVDTDNEFIYKRNLLSN